MHMHASSHRMDESANGGSVDSVSAKLYEASVGTQIALALEAKPGLDATAAGEWAQDMTGLPLIAGLARTLSRPATNAPAV